MLCWEVFPLIPCCNLLSISEGQFHAPFPQLLGHPQKKKGRNSWQRLSSVVTHALECCWNVGSLPLGASPYHTCGGTVIHTRHKTPMSGVLLAASGAQLGPAAKTNRDLPFYGLSQQKLRERGFYSRLSKVCTYTCVCLWLTGWAGESSSVAPYIKDPPTLLP